MNEQHKTDSAPLFAGYTISKLRAREAAAVQGPWEIRLGGNYTDIGRSGYNDYCDSANDTATPLRVAKMQSRSGNGAFGQNLEEEEANARFIIAARNALPELLDKIDRLQAELSEARKDTARLDGIIDADSDGVEAGGFLADWVWDLAAELCPIDSDEAGDTRKWARAAIDAALAKGGRQ